VGALIALAVWPAFASRATAGDPTAGPTPAPLRDDVTIRARTIAFEESRLALDGQDQITPRLLAEQYLQRYRERGDVGDVLRAQAQAQRSLRIQPQGNVAALQELASAQLALHQFHAALATARAARRWAPADPSLAMGEASLDMELGEYAAARALVAHTRDAEATTGVAARLAEVTGDLPRAQVLLGRAARRVDAIYGMPNERRAWYHVRLGELAFEAGDAEDALREEAVALERFADDAQALTDAARFDAALGRWSEARVFAEHAVRITPSPENLGLLADAQQRLGDRADADATRDEIVAVERIGNAQHLVDRLLASYYADHGVRLEDAYAIAARDAASRPDVYAEDTLAWAAARAGRWDVARIAARRALAWNTPDARMWYHAGVIAEHDGDRPRALADDRRALALNPHFQAIFADDARRRIAGLEVPMETVSIFTAIGALRPFHERQLASDLTDAPR
jgi:tetratricopeptide (TPR) repeat protein